MGSNKVNSITGLMFVLIVLTTISGGLTHSGLLINSFDENTLFGIVGFILLFLPILILFIILIVKVLRS
jgi:hypothetical protein